MATFDLKFNASTTGIHRVGYDSATALTGVPTFDFNVLTNSYTVVDVNVTTVGEQTLTIEYDGSLYCTAAVYFGYVIASCQPQADTTGNGIPDDAVTWSVNLDRQSDLTALTEITCVATPIQGATVPSWAGGCIDGVYPLVITPTTVGDDLITAVGTLTMGLSGSSTVINFTNKGLYKQAPVITVPSLACDPGVAIDVSMGISAITFSDYIPTNGEVIEATDSIYNFSIGESTKKVTDQSVSLPQAFEGVKVSNGYCTTCETITIDATANVSGSCKVTYNEAWGGGADFRLVTQTVNPGQTLVTSCAVKGSFILTSNFNPEPIITKTDGCSLYE